MHFRLNKLLHELTTLLVAVAFVVAAFGPAISASHAASAALKCSSFSSSEFQAGSDRVPELVGTFTHYGSVLNQFDIGNSSDNPNRDAKSQCCNSFCSPAFISLADPNTDALVPIDNDDWPAFVQALIPTDIGHPKRPPRASAS